MLGNAAGEGILSQWIYNTICSICGDVLYIKHFLCIWILAEGDDVLWKQSVCLMRVDNTSHSFLGVNIIEYSISGGIKEEPYLGLFLSKQVWHLISAVTVFLTCR